jgi:uncharacterized protein (TIGR02996 family)
VVRSPRWRRLRRLSLHDVDGPRRPVRQALVDRFGQRVVIHLDDDEDELPPAPPRTRSEREAGAFLDDIRRHPDDDAPRLIYADWLDEHGDAERAEFIRLQCRVAVLPEDDPRREALARREAELLQGNWRRWTEEAFLAWLEHPPARCPIYDPHEVCEIFAEATRRRLQSDDPDLEELEARIEPFNYRGYELHLPFFSQAVFRRGFIDQAGVEEVPLFTFAPALCDLGMVRHLAVLFDDAEPMIGDDVIRRLICTMSAPPLLSLDLGTMVEGFDGLRALAAWPGVAELRRFTGLTVSRHYSVEEPDDEAVVILARSPYLGKLEHLHLNLGNSYTDRAVEAILDSPTLKALKTVQLYGDDHELSAAVLRRFRKRFGVPHPDDRD